MAKKTNKPKTIKEEDLFLAPETRVHIEPDPAEVKASKKFFKSTPSALDLLIQHDPLADLGHHFRGIIALSLYIIYQVLVLREKGGLFL